MAKIDQLNLSNVLAQNEASTSCNFHLYHSLAVSVFLFITIGDLFHD